MAEAKIIKISRSCELVIVKYENLQAVDVTIDYTEHSPAYGYGDTFTSVDIDKEKAQEIVAALQDAFDLDK